MVNDLKFFDGSLARIDRVPADAARQVYATAFEVDPAWMVEAASRRQKWIDQAQSLNIYMAGASGKKLHDTYTLAWLRGLKTTYYLRTLAATSAEKSTTDQDRATECGVVPTAASGSGFSYKDHQHEWFGCERGGRIRWPRTNRSRRNSARSMIPTCEACQ